jgi:hypothetical protein
MENKKGKDIMDIIYSTLEITTAYYDININQAKNSFSASLIAIIYSKIFRN